MSDSTKAVADKLVELCRQGRNDEALETLYASDIVSIESMEMPDMPSEMRGIDAVRAKGQWWTDNNEVHSATVNGPFIGPDGQFAVEFSFETTFKPTGERNVMNEMALYTVTDGKISRERFYYKP